MDFTETPKQVVQIFTWTLDLENFADVICLWNTFHHLVNQLRFWECFWAVRCKVVKHLVFFRTAMRLIIFEQSKARYEVHAASVSVVSNFRSPTDLTAEASRERCCDVITECENSNFEWISHPSFPEHCVGMLDFSLNWSSFVGSKGTDGSSPHEFYLFDLHQLVDFLCVRTVISVWNLNFLNVMFTRTQLWVLNVSEFPVYIQKRVHITIKL